MKPIVAIMMGSDSDADKLKPCADTLTELGIPFEARVLSAHRTPTEAVDYARNAKANGFRVMICAAGGAAHLAGVVAANTELPVIGIPVEVPPLGGLDSLLSTVQMPAGTPVGTVAVGAGGVKNAAFLAARILALSDEKLAKALVDLKKKTADKVLAKKLAY
ncbi:MAG TPA: 5-(carboxyamino)imidazole ribonucleotide mutase [Candidatus Eisenbacteria bacterium]|jgi:phosphoribosylaminoimidazole carboxylase PurE protein|nr:5-(carboxyamino)imidazole ribonucleotide mutase [Candidatus Eisenbacteria bacterium]